MTPVHDPRHFFHHDLSQPGVRHFDPKWSDNQLIDFMVQHPILMNRPSSMREVAVSHVDASLPRCEAGARAWAGGMVWISPERHGAMTGSMKPLAYCVRLVDVMEELMKFTLLTRPAAGFDQRDLGLYRVS